MSYMSIAKSNTPNIFVGKYAQKNIKLLSKLDNSFLDSKRYRLNGIRNGIAIFEDSSQYNFGTTKVRRFLGLDANDNLVMLKDKAIYRCEPSKKDRRTLTGAWNFDYRNNVMTRRTATSVDGKLKEVSIYKENEAGQDVVNQFYFMPNINTKYEHIYDYANGIYTKLLKDPHGARGTVLEYGKIINANDETMPKFVKDDVLVSHPVLGKSVDRKTPAAIFYSTSSAVCNFLASFFA